MKDWTENDGKFCDIGTFGKLVSGKKSTENVKNNKEKRCNEHFGEEVLKSI